MTATRSNGVFTEGQYRAAREFAKFWTAGRRHNAAKTLAGGLGRAGWPANRICAFVDELVTLTNDEEPENRAEAVKDTLEALKESRPVTSWPTLRRLLGPDGEAAVQALLDGLDIGSKLDALTHQ